MQVEEITRSLGKPVRDLYGRHIGFISGFSVEGSGKIRAVGLEGGSGRFEEYPGSRFVVGEEGPILVPEWKVETESLGRESSSIRKRIDALDILAKTGEIQQRLHEEMSKEYAARLKNLDEVIIQHSKRLSARITELDAEVEALDRFIVNLKIQRHSGELEEDLFAKVNANFTAMRAKDLQEKEELSRALEGVSAPLETRLTMTITQKSDAQA